MGQKVVDTCRNCGAEIAPGASFCTLCGTAVPNRSAAAAPSTVPLVGQPFTGQAPAPVQPPVAGQAPGAAPSLPGVITVGIGTTAPLVAPQQVGGDARFAAAATLVPGGAGRRLAAKLIDGVPPAILAVVVGVLVIVQMGGVSTEADLAAFQRNMLLTYSAFLLLCLAYGLWLWIWEARTGKTPGNAMLGLRTTNMAGERAGFLAIFLRGLIIGLAGIVPTVGPILVIISNTWDPNGKWQGWHDKVAKTLVFDIKAGRNPMETGGVAGRESYEPAPVPTIATVNSPLPQPVAQQPQQFGFTQGTITTVPGFSAPAPGAGQVAPSGQQPTAAGYTEPVSFAPPAAAPPQAAPSDTGQPTWKTTEPLPAGDADEAAGETRIRPAAAKTPLRLAFDDGALQDVDTVALIGRNPAGYDGEMISRLITIRDTSMSVSKTHLHVRASNEGLWVTDRNSTNGSAITGTSGAKTPLAPNTPVLAEIGARVHFGERSFVVGRA